MLTVSAVATTVFLGGPWLYPGATREPLMGWLPTYSAIYFLLKIAFFMFVFIWLRATQPQASPIPPSLEGFGAFAPPAG